MSYLISFMLDALMLLGPVALLAASVYIAINRPGPGGVLMSIGTACNLLLMKFGRIMSYFDYEVADGYGNLTGIGEIIYVLDVLAIGLLAYGFYLFLRDHHLIASADHKETPTVT